MFLEIANPIVMYDNETSQTGLFKHDWIILWIVTPWDE